MQSLNFRENQRQEKKRMRSVSRETYHYATCQRMNKKQWDELAKRYGVVNDQIRDGKTLVAYRRVREMTEAERVISEGRY